MGELLTNALIGNYAVPRIVRAGLFALLTRHDIHPSATISAKLLLSGSSRLSVGQFSRINYRCLIELSAPVTIGANTSLGPDVAIVTASSWAALPEDKRAITPQGVSIGDGCWIGAGSTILPGVTIGRGTVIAAGSVVGAACEPDSLYAGNPAKLKRRLPREG